MYAQIIRLGILSKFIEGNDITVLIRKLEFCPIKLKTSNLKIDNIIRCIFKTVRLVAYFNDNMQLQCTVSDVNPTRKCRCRSGVCITARSHPYHANTCLSRLCWLHDLCPTLSCCWHKHCPDTGDQRCCCCCRYRKPELN